MTVNEYENSYQFTILDWFEWVQPAGVNMYQHGYNKEESIIRNFCAALALTLTLTHTLTHTHTWP